MTDAMASPAAPPAARPARPAPDAPGPRAATGDRNRTGTEARRISAQVLELLLPHRRAAEPGPLPGRPGAAGAAGPGGAPGSTPPDPEDPGAFGEQLDQVGRFVRAGEPIVLTLPGFPCKSPNPAKVLGHLPDEGERLSLTFLDRLCARIGEIHRPGATLVICSDGHVFGDLIRVPDAHIDAYADELRAMIAREGLTHLRTFDLRDAYGDLGHDDKRALVQAEYAPAADALRAEVRTDEDTLRLYRGITRFLVEDTPGYAGTRSALQRECRSRAYGVIARSRAWGELIAAHRPHSVRLSIHPQRRGSAKFGIRLLDAEDVWVTPWHSAVLRRADGGSRLMRRAEAERLGRLVLRDGRPSHFQAR
ncbi:L-tyrosine/L-tryptophan isonitrile synthase family protein [Streptomyces sp. NPDC018031]|uniref:L-tyrosine/L-tryptophan isonitrile synthase family protein n=1 Tax=Streptomyces sp. NPDC018031 TaxID=3365033 RepID=UPI003797A1AF